MVPNVTGYTLRAVLKQHADSRSVLMSDDAGQYRHMHRDFTHHVVNRGANEYVRQIEGMLAHQYRRRIFRDPEAGNNWRLSQRQRSPPSSLFGRI